MNPPAIPERRRPTVEERFPMGLDTMNCCLCKKDFQDPIGNMGNNPDPCAKNGRCCDDCNTYVVIPCRWILGKRKMSNIQIKAFVQYQLDRMDTLKENKSPI